MAAPLRLIVERDGQPPYYFQTERPFARIGRSPRCDLPLKDKGVSSRHVHVQVVQGHALCVDLLSRSGLTWSTGRADWGWLEPRERIAVGPFRIGLDRPIETLPGCVRPAENPVKTSRDGRLLQPIVLEFLGQGTRNRTLRVSRLVTVIGRSPGCKIQLNDESISRTHCCLVLTPTGAWVIDLMGRGGVKVNGRRVDFAFLGGRTELRVGKILMRVNYESSASHHAGFTAQGVGNSRSAAAGSPLAGSGIDAQSAGHTTSSTPTLTSPDQTFGRSLDIKPLTVVRPALDLGFPSPESLGEFDGNQNELIRALVGRLAAFHQQMFEQNQQTITMIVHLFSRMHREHLEMVHDELNRLNQLTEEMRVLQRELASVSPERRGRPVSPDERNPVRPPSTAGAGAEAALRRAALVESFNVPPVLAHPPSDTPSADAPAQPAVVQPAAAETSPVPESLTNPEDVHIWLEQRMAAIEAERQTLWDKVCHVLKLP